MSKERSFPAPQKYVENEDFWAACNDGKLMLPRCKDTGKVFWYPRKISPFTLSGNVEWIQASGKGVIYTYSVMRRTEPNFAIAYVTLEEGVTVMTNLVDCDFDALAVGQTVELAWRTAEGGQKVPVFKPAG